MAYRIAVLLVAFCGILGWRQSHADEASASTVVHCYDPSTDAIEDKYRGECKGTVMSDAEAERARQARDRRNLRAIREQPLPVDPSFVMKSAGTGFFVADDASLLTNAHVIDPCDALTVETREGGMVRARLVAADTKLDLALVRAETRPPAVATLQAHVDFMGQPVSVIGYPDLGMPSIRPVTVAGVLSGPAFSNSGRFEFRADVRPGNSGGPIIDSDGMVVGIVAAKVDSVATFQRTGQTVTDVGFGISAEAIDAFLTGHGVTPRHDVPPSAADAGGVDVSSASSVVRVACWRR